MNSNFVDIEERHVNWLVELMENEENLTEWEREFVLDITEKITDGRLTAFSRPQEDKLRQIAYDRLVD